MVQVNTVSHPGPRHSTRSRQLKVRLAALGLLLALPVSALGLIELLVHVPLWEPRALNLLPWQLVSAYKPYYVRADRDIIQFNPDCAQYSSDLFYTLKPGTCTFANREFSTSFHINSLGVRDDEESLQQPEVVVLGDSEAMGWGVEQDESFAQIIERETGMRVLNAAISSYGTARELKILNKIDRSRLRYVVIQYCTNDLEENEKFLAHDGVLPIEGPDAYVAAARSWNERSKPWLSTFLLRELLPQPAVAATVSGRAAFSEDATREAAAFTQVLARGMQWDGIQLIAMEINGNRGIDPKFDDYVRQLLQAEDVPPALRSATILDLSSVLTPENYFTLDYEHINQRGHQAVASRVKAAF